MIVLHLGLCNRQWLLWGERAIEEAKLPAKRGRKPKSPDKPAAERSPYDTDVEQLLEALEAAEINAAQYRQKNSRMSILWSPTAGGRPVASSLLVAEPPAASDEIVLRPWKVSVVGLTTRDTIDFLAACMDKTALIHGVALGKDIAFWTQALRFTAALVVRERFLPRLAVQEGKYYARWEPLITGNDLKHLRDLAAAMPDACRALTADSAEIKVQSALTVVKEAVSLTADKLVRLDAEEKLTTVAARLPVKADNAQERFDSIHDQWLYALCSTDGEMSGSQAELAQFAAQLQEWRRKALFLSTAPFRFCFRVEEPEQEDKEDRSANKTRKKNRHDQWTVAYLLQAVDDPSLIITAKDAWKGTGKTAQVFKERAFSVNEFLLTALGQAAGICPNVEESLKAAKPAGFTVDTAGAYAFLTETASLLEQAGFGLLAPAWWTKRGAGVRLAAKARVKSPALQAGGGLSLDNIVDFNWEISLGDEVLSAAELEALVNLKSPLVKIRGQWVELNGAQLQSALEYWRRRGAQSMTAREAVRMALGAAKTPGDMAFAGVAAEGWIAELIAKLEGRTPWSQLPQPHGLTGALRPYQLRGYSWLTFLSEWGFGACLADDMGLGKTIQTLALIQAKRESGEKRPALLVCPTSVMGNWQKETEKFTPGLPVMLHHGFDRNKSKTAFKKEAERHGLVITGYSLLSRDFELLQKVDWSGIILDEAQNIKNAQTKQAKAARSLAGGYRVALTGTPVENNVGDLWSLMEYLNPGMLGGQAEFKRNFFAPIQFNRDEQAAEKLKRLTGPFILRRLKTDKQIITDLPEKMEMKVYCTLTKEQASLYAAVLREMEEGLDESEGIQRKGLVLAALTKLKQVCNHPALFLNDGSSVSGRSGKLARLTEMCEEILAAGDRALIFSQFTEMGHMLRRHLMEHFGREALFLHGGVAKKERDRMVELFQSDKGPPLFVISLKAGGTGLNLTRANHVFHYDRWWNPAVEDQATDRAFRIGQAKNVQVHKFICTGTLEDKIDAMIERKKELAGQVVGTGEGWLTELSTAELRDILALSQEAIGD
ncbi:RNA polymerase-associated protein RapA [Sporomusa carbonis]|uniref:DEAD/DEAH box helicase n=1 Tax=Sporomusa carbonis TaxID=3076075 RepID=UPI003A759764